jgi:cobalt-zinc-cadmium efflux system outer membrane protein
MNRQFIVTLFVGGFALYAQTPSASLRARYVSETLGLASADLVQAVLTSNKDLQAAREQLRQAEARLVQSGLRPNPTLDATYSTERFTENKGAGGYSASLTQPFELGGKRARRVRVAEVAVEIARAQIADAERLAIGQARILYGEAVAAADRLDILERTTDLNQQMLKVMLVQRKAGDASRLDETLLRATANQLDAQRFQADARAAGFLLQIKNLMGLRPEAPLLLRALAEPAPLTLTEAAAVSLALASRPDLKAARLREEMAEAGIDLAKSEVIPTIGASVRFSQDKLVLEDLPTPGARYLEKDREISFGISIPLPLFNRQQGAIAESVSQRAQAKAQRESTELTVRREVAAAYRNYEAAQRTLEALRTGVVGQNQESFQIVRLAYQLGELRLLDVVNQQRILIDAQTVYAGAQRDYFVAIADMERALGR